MFRYSLEFDAALEEHLKELAREGQQLVDVEEMVGDEDIEGHSRVTGIQQQSDLIQELLSIALSGSRYAVGLSCVCVCVCVCVCF